MNLQEEKAKLVDAYAKVLEQINKYWSVPNTETEWLIKKKEELQNRIEELNKLLNYND